MTIPKQAMLGKAERLKLESELELDLESQKTALRRLFSNGVGVFTVIQLRVLVLCFAVFTGACAQIQHQTSQRVEQKLRSSRADEALQILENQNYSAKASALYLLNKAMVLRQMGRYQESVAALEKVKKEIGRLNATSISESLMAYTVSEQFGSYTPVTYEHLFVHIFQIMNFLALGQLDSARVEALQIDLALTRLSDAGHHREAAYSRYLTGLVFEANHERDNAYIAYSSAEQNYQSAQLAVPKDLQWRLHYLSGSPGADLARPISEKSIGLESTNKGGSTKSLSESIVVASDIEPSESTKNMAENIYRAGIKPQALQGQLIIFVDIDFAPSKTVMDTTLVDPLSGHIVRVSLPRYISRNLEGLNFRFRLSDSSFTSELVADIEAMAFEDLRRKMPKLEGRAISRNISKYVVAEKASDESEILGQMVSIFGAILEQADNRNWLTLPNKTHVASRVLDEGRYALGIEILDRNNNIIERREVQDVDIAAKQFTFINFTWLDAQAPSIH